MLCVDVAWRIYSVAWISRGVFCVFCVYFLCFLTPFMMCFHTPYFVDVAPPFFVSGFAGDGEKTVPGSGSEPPTFGFTVRRSIQLSYPGYTLVWQGRINIAWGLWQMFSAGPLRHICWIIFVWAYHSITAISGLYERFGIWGGQVSRDATMVGVEQENFENLEPLDRRNGHFRVLFHREGHKIIFNTRTVSIKLSLNARRTRAPNWHAN